MSYQCDAMAQCDVHACDATKAWSVDISGATHTEEN